MAQRLTTWVLSRVAVLLDLPLSSRNDPQPCSNDQSGANTPKLLSELPTSHIQLLPPELRTEILKYLQWKDLLNASLICRRWYQATKSKQLWLSLARYLKSIPGVGRMEEPIGDYSVAELQRWVLKRLRVQESWTVENTPLTFNQRKLQIYRREYLQLLPGGRWLLVNDKEGRFYSYDLNLREPKRRLLIDWPDSEVEDDESSYVRDFCYWINTSKAKLTLRVAFFETAFGGGHNTTRTRIYELNLMGHGEESFLEARPTVSLEDKELAQSFWRPGVALTGEYFIESLAETPTNDVFLSITKYFDNDKKYYKGIPLQVRLENNLHIYKLYATTEHIVLTFRTCVHIYSITQLLSHDKETILLPLQLISCDIGLSISPLWSFEDYMELTYCRHDQFWLLRMFTDGRPSKNVLLGKKTLDYIEGDIVFTPSTFVYLHPDFTDIITYECDIDDMETVVLSGKLAPFPRLNIHLPRLPQRVGVEPGIGRMVLARPMMGECYILDTA